MSLASASCSPGVKPESRCTVFARGCASARGTRPAAENARPAPADPVNKSRRVIMNRSCSPDSTTSSAPWPGHFLSQDVARQGSMCLIFGLLFPYQRLILERRRHIGHRRLTIIGIGSLRYLFENYVFDTDRRELQRGAD